MPELLSLCSPSSLEGPRSEVVPGLFCVLDYQGASVDGSGRSVLVTLQRSGRRLLRLRPSQSKWYHGPLSQQVVKRGRRKLVVRYTKQFGLQHPEYIPACASSPCAPVCSFKPGSHLHTSRAGAFPFRVARDICHIRGCLAATWRVVASSPHMQDAMHDAFNHVCAHAADTSFVHAMADVGQFQQVLLTIVASKSHLHQLISSSNP